MVYLTIRSNCRNPYPNLINPKNQKIRPKIRPWNPTLLPPDLLTENFPGLLVWTIRFAVYWYVFWRALIKIGVLQPEIIANNHPTAPKFSVNYSRPVCRRHPRIVLLLEEPSLQTHTWMRAVNCQPWFPRESCRYGLDRTVWMQQYGL